MRNETTNRSKKMKNRMIKVNEPISSEAVECEFVFLLQKEYSTSGEEFQMCLWRNTETGRSFQGCVNEGTEV